VTTAQVFARSREGLASPDLQLLFTPASYALGEFGMLESEPGMTCAVCPVKPDSRGTVMARSADPFEKPAIRPNYLSARSDQHLMEAGVRMVRDIFAQPAIAPHGVQETLPGPEVTTAEEILAFNRQYGTTIYHPVGTCRMGEGPDAVVDSRLRLRGIGGLRVIDASVMPTLTTGNTNAPTIMIGRKGSDAAGGCGAVRGAPERGAAPLRTSPRQRLKAFGNQYLVGGGAPFHGPRSPVKPRVPRALSPRRAGVRGRAEPSPIPSSPGPVLLDQPAAVLAGLLYPFIGHDAADAGDVVQQLLAGRAGIHAVLGEGGQGLAGVLLRQFVAAAFGAVAAARMASCNSFGRPCKARREISTAFFVWVKPSGVKTFAVVQASGVHAGGRGGDLRLHHAVAKAWASSALCTRVGWAPMSWEKRLVIGE